MNTIPNFKDSHRFLSNFWWVKITLDGVVYPSTEHAFQAAKTIDPKEREIILNAKTFGDAKRLGHKITMRDGWDNMRNGVMFDLNLQKFTKYPLLKSALLQTGDAELIEGNWWHDMYWGVCNCSEHGGKGENHLGKTLMAVRAHLREVEKTRRKL